MGCFQLWACDCCPDQEGASLPSLPPNPSPFWRYRGAPRPQSSQLVHSDMAPFLGSCPWPGQPTGSPSPNLILCWSIMILTVMGQHRKNRGRCYRHSLHERPMARSANKLIIHFDSSAVKWGKDRVITCSLCSFGYMSRIWQLCGFCRTRSVNPLN